MAEIIHVPYEGFKNRGCAGTPLAEVFSVVINTGDAEECQLYGTIEVEDSNGTLLIYDQKQEDPQTIKQNGSLRLINRERAISGYDRFTVDVNLKNKYGDVFINSSFVWDEEMGYDKLLSADVGENGSAKVTMYYTVYEVAIEANIWVHYEQDESENCDYVKVDGRVIARFKERYDWPKAHGQKEYREITMFECASFELEDKDIVQLPRSVVVVSLFHSLIIMVDLKCCGGEEKLWSGEVEFVPNRIIMDSSCVEIEGKYGSLVVSALGFRYMESLEDVNAWKRGFRKSNTMF